MIFGDVQIGTEFTDGTHHFMKVAPNKPGDGYKETVRHAQKYVDSSRKYNKAVGVVRQLVFGEYK